MIHWKREPLRVGVYYNAYAENGAFLGRIIGHYGQKCLEAHCTEWEVPDLESWHNTRQEAMKALEDSIT